jgi:hypothetical protein
MGSRLEYDHRGFETRHFIILPTLASLLNSHVGSRGKTLKMSEDLRSKRFEALCQPLESP